ncbi:MAG: hypothetical protein IJX01_05960 [Oscillospiraceae bacterium]|nr:hypothetical protein [Oscillospiraceae bacterium]
MDWKALEQKVRAIASLRWNCNASAETIAGIKCDCVLKPEDDRWVIVEVTKENNLDKVRSDIIKLRTVRGAVISQEIYCKCYFVMEQKPTDMMRQSGAEQRVTVMSLEEFQNEYFDYGSYIYTRSQRQFGSLINFETGEPENNVYIDVRYIHSKTGREQSITDIINMLKKGKKVVLKGDFGLGKSRCVKQVFETLSSDAINNPYTIAINLRDHWGAKRGMEILTRHFQELGLDANNFIKSYDRPNVIYLLDGFDEIGTQSWSSDLKKMQHIREMSVCGLKDLITKVQGGVLIVGREYYFNSDNELLSCLGLNEDNTTILECHHEFTETEIVAFIKHNIVSAPGIDTLECLPSWLPKRPLIMQLLLKYASDIFSVEYALDDICGFWYAFLTKMCEREAKINPTLNPEIIKNVLIYLANETRTCLQNTGPITQNDLSIAFTSATGISPSDETSIMLQRLPSLGRVSADSPDRQFLDPFVLNGLRAETIIQMSKSWDLNLMSTEWTNPLDQVGLCILAEYIAKEERRADSFFTLAKKAAISNNKVLASDIVAALCLQDTLRLDFKGIDISQGHFSYLSFEGKHVCNLTLRDTVIERLDLTNAKLDENVSLCKCLIGTAYGIASHKSLPDSFQDCTIDDFEALATTTLIKKARLSEPQKLFVQMLRKIFYQPGAGRKEAALLRGMGASANKQLGEQLLHYLLEEKLVTRHKGDEGFIYKPVRGEMGRIDKILTDLTLSSDPLWIKISALS